jgi:hypothetical protein
VGNSAHIQRPLEQRRTGGGKGTEYRLPKCGNIFSNHSYFPRRCNAELAPPASPGKKCWHVRRSNELGGEFGITPRRLRLSRPAPSPGVAKVEFPAFPPLVLRCSSGRPHVIETTGASSALRRQNYSYRSGAHHPGVGTIVILLSSAGPPLLQRSRGGRNRGRRRRASLSAPFRPLPAA